MKPTNSTTLVELCLSASAAYKEHTAFAMISEGEIVSSISYEQMGKRSRQIGLLLTQLGIQKGDRVLLFSDNCPEWPLSYFGISFAGAVSVPLLTGFSAEQTKNIAVHAGINAICMNRAMTEKIEQVLAVPEFSKKPIIFIDTMKETAESNIEVTVSIGGNEQKMMLPKVSETTSSGESTENLQNDPNALATIIYTSGTQGNSKGVMLSSKNILSSAFSSLSFVTLTPEDRLLSVLPLAHSYECNLGLLAPVFSGASITYLDKPPSPSVMLPALKLIQPTAMLAVPLLIEKIYNNGIAPKLKVNALYKFPLTRPLAIRVAGKKLHATMGGKLRFFAVGGAPLAPEVEEFLYKAKFPYTIGYGLTEAAPLVSGNRPFEIKPNIGGRAVGNVTMRIAECDIPTAPGIGEIQVYGPNVMLGYYKEPEKTAETITSDGWLRTGDLGWIGKNGRVHIRGRLKALILGPSGENIYPEEIEGLLGSSTLVEDVLVFLSAKGELVALIRLSEAAKAVTGAIEHALEDLRSWVNNKLAVFSHLNRIEIRYEPFEKTPTMKIKRYLYV